MRGPRLRHIEFDGRSTNDKLGNTGRDSDPGGARGGGTTPSPPPPEHRPVWTLPGLVARQGDRSRHGRLGMPTTACGTRCTCRRRAARRPRPAHHSRGGAGMTLVVRTYQRPDWLNRLMRRFIRYYLPRHAVPRIRYLGRAVVAPPPRPLPTSPAPRRRFRSQQHRPRPGPAPCVHCGVSIYLIDTDWVHTNGSFACRGDGGQVMPTYATPGPLHARAHHTPRGDR